MTSSASIFRWIDGRTLLRGRQARKYVATFQIRQIKRLDHNYSSKI